MFESLCLDTLVSFDRPALPGANGDGSVLWGLFIIKSAGWACEVVLQCTMSLVSHMMSSKENKEVRVSADTLEGA